MSDIRPDSVYDGTVLGGARWYYARTGTLGLQLQLECSDGEIDHTLWITEKNKDRITEILCDVFGVAYKNLQNQTYLENQLAIDIEGKACSFTTVEEEYRGDSRVKVGFINKPRAAGDLPPCAAAAMMFGGKPKASKPATPQAPPKPVIDDSEVPF